MKLLMELYVILDISTAVRKTWTHLIAQPLMRMLMIRSRCTVRALWSAHIH